LIENVCHNATLDAQFIARVPHDDRLSNR